MEINRVDENNVTISATNDELLALFEAVDMGIGAMCWEHREPIRVSMLNTYLEFTGEPIIETNEDGFINR